MLRSIISTLFLSILFFSCTENAETSKDEDILRPHDPWVFRSVLDTMPRMLTIALNENLWAAYRTNDCSLYKVWKGYVSLEGAVYNTHHGPQPISMGDAYIVNEVNNPWSVIKGGQNILKKAHYKGHRLVEDHVQLMVDLETNDGVIIKVTEQPEYARSATGQIGFERNFTALNVPTGVEVMNVSSISSIVTQSKVESNQAIIFEDEKETSLNGITTLNAKIMIPISADKETTTTAFFVKTPTIISTIEQGAEEENLPFGYRLVAQNDCKTCHNVNVKTIGPAYADVAAKYPTDESTVQSLSNKIIKGGAGIWGSQVMSAHPELGENDAKEMVRWILSLDKDDTGGEEKAEAVAAEQYQESVDLGDAALIPGLATRVYKTKTSDTKMPSFGPNDKPIMAGVMPNFDNMSGGDFKGLEDYFAIVAEGYLNIEEEGEYSIRVWSDDGSLFTLNGEQIIDNDGMHGTEGKDVLIGLKKGPHPFKLEMFDGVGGHFLSLNWKKPGDANFEIIPTNYLMHTADMRAGLEGLKLPMSVLKKTPGDQNPVAGVHPAYNLQLARPYDFLPKVGGMDFLPDGRLVVCTWDPTGAVYLIDNALTGNPSEMSFKRIAAGLAEPLGLKVVDGDIYVLQKQELTKLVDTDGDDIIDEYHLVSNDWETSANFHEFAFGLEYVDGYFYGTLATAIMPGGASANPQIQDRGKVIKISKDKGTVEFVASGLRTPNGIGKGVDDELFVCDNQGDWLPSSKLVHVQPGAWYGSRSVDFEGTANSTETKPVVWLPQDEIGNSPSTPLAINDGPYKGQMIHGEVTHGGVKRDFIEKVNGQYQGAVFRFIQGLEAGVNRMVWGPDGALYIGGIGSTGNWQQSGKLWYGLQKLKYNGTSAFEMLAVRAKSNGVEIEFTEALREGEGWSANDYNIEQWEYVPTADYGGPKVDLKKLNIQSVNISDDRKKVFLQLNGMQENRVVYIRLLYPFVSENNNGLWSTEAWYTMNKLPKGEPGFVSKNKRILENNSLTSKQKSEGWQLLFDGQSLDKFKGFKKDEVGSSWKISNGTFTLKTQRNDEGVAFAPDGGDLLTKEEFENFELELEWKISNCGNSGIMFGVKEDEKYDAPYLTGPEMQILDNSCHPDTRYPTHRAGDLYDMIESKYVTVNPSGEWNKIRLIKKDGIVEQWQNGHKIVEYEMFNKKWDRMVSKSKFKDWEDFGKFKSGKIALQDHGDEVSFRNVKIRRL